MFPGGKEREVSGMKQVKQIALKIFYVKKLPLK